MGNSNAGTKKVREKSSPKITDASGIVNNVAETAAKLQEQVKVRTGQIGETVGKAREKVSANLINVAGSIHTNADNAQKILDEKADKFNDYAHQALNKANQLGHRTADALDSSSNYIKNFDYEETKEQVIETFREKPQLGFALAGIFGLIVGLLIGRRSS